MRTGALLVLVLLLLLLALALPVAGQEEPTPSPEVTITPLETTPEPTPSPAPEASVTPAGTTPGPTPSPSPGLSSHVPVAAPGPIVQAPPPSLDVTVDPASVAFGTGGIMQVPASYHAWVNVTVQAQGIANWFLSVEDGTSGTLHRGFLSTPIPADRNLTRPLEIWDFTLVPQAFRPVGAGKTAWYVSTRPGKTEVVTRFRQQTTTDDLAGVYAMTVSFTASPA